MFRHPVSSSDFTLIGTTDEDFHGDPADVSCSPDEERYLCDAVGDYLAHRSIRRDIVWRYAGVRPLLDDGASKAQEATRDYVLTLEAPAERAAPVGVRRQDHDVSPTGRSRLGEAGAILSRHARSLDSGCRVAGRDFPWDGMEHLRADLSRRYPFLPDATLQRLVRAYGTMTADVLGDARSLRDMGRSFGADLTEREVDWLVRTEWASRAEMSYGGEASLACV